MCRLAMAGILLAAACSAGSPAQPVDPPAPDAASPPFFVPLGQAVPPLELNFSLALDDLFWTTALQGHLYIEVADSRAVSGVLSLTGEHESTIAAVGGRVLNQYIGLDPGTIAIPLAGEPAGELAWDGITLTAIDTDGDGAIDRATGFSVGTWTSVKEGIFYSSAYRCRLTAELDQRARAAYLALPLGPSEASAPALLPYEPVVIDFEEPAYASEIAQSLRVLSGGEPLAIEVQTNAIGGLATRASMHADALLPFGAEIAVDLGGLADPSGNPLQNPVRMAAVIADPGSAAQNPSMEAGLSGFYARGPVDVVGEVEGLVPADGSAHAVVYQGAMLVGYWDVPEDASELDLGIAVLSENGTFVAEHTAVVTLHSAGQSRATIFDAAFTKQRSIPCKTCTRYGHLLGPLRQTADITSYRGQRIFLSVAVRPSIYALTQRYAVIVDDVRLR